MLDPMTPIADLVAEGCSLPEPSLCCSDDELELAFAGVRAKSPGRKSLRSSRSFINGVNDLINIQSELRQFRE